MNSIFAIQPLSVMISSRCLDPIAMADGTASTFAALRERLRDELESIHIADQALFKVWIHEDENHAPTETTWDACMRRARTTDLVLVLYNGNAGWGGDRLLLRENIGICHAEFSEAFHRAPGKIRSIQFSPLAPAEPNSPNARFQRDFLRQKIAAAQVSNFEEAVLRAKDAMVGAMLAMAHAGVGVNSLGSYYAGQALDWSRMDFQRRRQATINTMAEFLQERGGATRLSAADRTVVAYPLKALKLAFVCDCVPAAMSTAAARELVGQPFLNDFQITPLLKADMIGPVHLVACQKSVSESQALRQLGFPDAIVVVAPFGIYVADEVQKIQIIFMKDCRDETSTHHRVQRFLQWLEEQGEDEDFLKRAASRKRICEVIAKEFRTPETR